MTARIALRAGTPDDDNRDYLPASLKGTDVVVNENGNNSQPYPPRLREHRGEVADGLTDVWYTYVPERYDPAVATPLVVSLHGGLMSGWGQAVYSSWVNVADREGFVVLFPTAHHHGMWMIDLAEDADRRILEPNPEGLYLEEPPERVEDNHDVRVVLALIERMQADFTIDPQRVFVHGMSLGDVMTTQLARHFGSRFAGIAGSGGFTDPALLFDEEGVPRNRGGAVPVWQTRLDLDRPQTHYADRIDGVVRAGREYWLQVNGITAPPAITIRGSDNFAFYEGGAAPYVFRDVYGRDHGQTLDDAELVWDLLFSGARRQEDGGVGLGPTRDVRTGDAFAVAAAVGASHAWSSGRRVALSAEAFRRETLQYHGRGGDAVVRDAVLHVPLDFIASAFGAHLDAFDGGAVAVLRLADGRRLQFARGTVACVLDDRIVSMPTDAVLVGGMLCIGLGWFAERIAGLTVTTRAGVLYATDHPAHLSSHMADLLSDLLQ